MGDIWRPYNYSSGDTDTAVFIQFANGRDPMAHELWCHSLAGIYRKVHLTSQLEIANGTVGEFITNYLTSDRCRNGITGEVSINGSVQLLGLPDVWGGSFPYVSNADIPEYMWWVAGGWNGIYSTNSTNINSPIPTVN